MMMPSITRRALAWGQTSPDKAAEHDEYTRQHDLSHTGSVVLDRLESSEVQRREGLDGG